MKKNCGHASKCGCKDSSLETQVNPCVPESDCYSDECYEVICDSCVTNCNADIKYSVGNNTFEVPKGQRIDVTIQKLLIFLSNPSCSVSAAVGLRAYKITTSSFSLTWEGSDDFVYAISITSEDGSEAQYLVTQGLYHYSLTNLLPGKEYYVKVLAGQCESVSIKVKTL